MMGFREVMKEVNSAEYCEFVDMYSHMYEGRGDESCPNKAIAKCGDCKKAFCTFHGEVTIQKNKCYNCRGFNIKYE